MYIWCMKLKDWRAREGLTLAQAGELFGVSHPTVLRIEKGETSPSEESMRRIYEATKGEVTLHDFFTADGQPIPQIDEDAAA